MEGSAYSMTAVSSSRLIRIWSAEAGRGLFSRIRPPPQSVDAALVSRRSDFLHALSAPPASLTRRTHRKKHVCRHTRNSEQAKCLTINFNATRNHATANPARGTQRGPRRPARTNHPPRIAHPSPRSGTRAYRQRSVPSVAQVRPTAQVSFHHGKRRASATCMNLTSTVQRTGGGGCCPQVFNRRSRYPPADGTRHPPLSAYGFRPTCGHSSETARPTAENSR